jgi:phosphorylcholine metabolism protein LicD
MDKEIEKKAKPATYRGGKKTLKTLSEDLPVDLTQDEQRETGAQIASLIDELATHAAHEKQVKSSLKARKDELTSRVTAMSMRLNQKKKLAPVEVRVEADFREGVVRYYRTDTNAEIRTRPLEATERQEPIEFRGLETSDPERDE